MKHLAMANDEWSTLPPPGAAARALSLEIDVRRACNLRDLRKTMLGEDHFTGPAWGILLHLFDAHLQQARDTIGSLCAASGIPLTTLVRWLDRLGAEGLIVSRDDPLDARRRFVELTPAAADLMTLDFQGAATHLVAA